MRPKSACRQSLIENWSHAVFELSRDPEALRIGGQGIYDFEALSDMEKFQFVFMMNKWVANVYNGVLLRDQGVLDQQTLDFIASAIRCEGGAVWWASFPHPPEVKAYIADYLERFGDAVVPQTELFPYWVRPYDGTAGRS